MARCGCASALCTCTIQSGSANVAVVGLGSATNPYLITVDPAYVQGKSSGTVTVTVTGAGTSASPYQIQADAKFSPSGSMLQRGIKTMSFASNGVAVSSHVTFTTAFTAPPSVCATPAATIPQNWAVSVSNVQATGFDLWATRLAGSSTGNDMHWIAVGT
jgi:hypothetical protein